MTSLEHFVEEVDRLSRRLVRNVECCDRMLVDCCDLTLAQAYAVLTLYEQGETAMSELAMEMRLHSTTMTRMVDALVEKGLAERRPDAEDRRIVRVALTAKGARAASELQECKRRFLATAFGLLTEEERSEILSALRRLTSLVEDLGAQCCSQ